MAYNHLKPFDLRTLRYFLVVAEELHFGRAAVRLNMSQPPLSQQIRQLEDRLDVVLFKRSHHNVELTAAGLALKEQAPLIFQQLEKAVVTTRMTAAGSIGRLDIGVISSSLVGIIPRALDIFTSRYPDVDWQLHELTPALQIQGLLERRIDICLFRMPPHQEGLQREIIMQEALMVAMPRSHPLASQNTVSLMQLKDHPFVMFGLHQSRFADFLYQCCVKAGFTPRIRQQVVEVQSLLSLVGANIGVALLPASMRQLAQPEVVFKPIHPSPPEIPLYATYRAGDTSPTLKRFLAIIGELITEHQINTASDESDRQIQSVFEAQESNTD
ncbi:LysR substrate-binding domain-containing protein [Brucella pecoris]|uniref:DNA-binding transcriptional LysR family regulator n=1 Tax=Brucella pecoris TaxID=867683 RepID=A0A5C5CHE8_9HYPH|nr:LysR substrate-binding domain-containing protein [Brucella pecoris]MBB4095235.1 DNA-binding transcriptional LysR family regulator [Brucella pecoris]TNV10544.1 LysR family transcriptional regulator [Brucella pecoris]